MDDVVADLKVTKTQQWMGKTESNGVWLLRKSRLTQGCSAERMDGWILTWEAKQESKYLAILRTAIFRPLYIRPQKFHTVLLI